MLIPASDRPELQCRRLLPQDLSSRYLYPGNASELQYLSLSQRDVFGWDLFARQRKKRSPGHHQLLPGTAMVLFGNLRAVSQQHELLGRYSDLRPLHTHLFVPPHPQYRKPDQESRIRHRPVGLDRCGSNLEFLRCRRMWEFRFGIRQLPHERSKAMCPNPSVFNPGHLPLRSHVPYRGYE